MLCQPPARPPRMPKRSVSCTAAIEEEEVEVVRRWIPVEHQRQHQGREAVHHSVPKRHLNHSQSNEQDPKEMKVRQAEIIAQYDLNTLHAPLLEPFLGSMYWTAATPLPNRKIIRQSSSPSNLACSSSVCTSPVTNAIEIAQVTSFSPGFGLRKQNPIDASTHCTEDMSRTDDEINLSLNSINFNIGQVEQERQRNADVSRELLDYSVLDDDIEVSPGLPQTPRRLFEEEEMVTPSRLIDNSILEAEGEDGSDLVYVANDEFETIPSPGMYASRYARDNMTSQPSSPSQNNISPTISEINMEVSRINYPATPSAHGPITPPKPLPPSPNIATFYGHWGSCRERHVSTLPSQIAGKPIKLRITETRPTDMFSYDPYYSSGTYVITTENNRTYGNGLLMRMGTQFMTLEDGRGCTLAVIKSRYTHKPSSVVYAPKPRFADQAPSGHRLSNLTSGNAAEFHSSSELYPWALICKEGRTMNDACTVHLVDENVVRVKKANARRNSGMFVTTPHFRGCHSFEGEWNTHTLVTRSVSGKNVGSKDVPCCVIGRDPMDVDAVDVTIAPGIDPLMMICYLAAHSKMDVEPIMGGF